MTVQSRTVRRDPAGATITDAQHSMPFPYSWAHAVDPGNAPLVPWVPRLVMHVVAFCLAALCLSTVACHRAGVAPASGRSLRVMTYNIAAGGGDLSGIARTIREANPDIVALQEVDVHWHARSKFADQVAELSAALGMQARFAPIYSFANADSVGPPRQYGIAVLSRYPVTAFRNHLLTRLSTQLPVTTPIPLPGFLEATIDVAGTTVRVFNTHLDYRGDPSLRVTEVRETLAIMGEVSGPTLLFGDLNATAESMELAPLLARLRDLWSADAGQGLSYPAKEPVKRIDFVLGSAHFRATSTRVVESMASDHRPVVMDLVMVRR